MEWLKPFLPFLQSVLKLYLNTHVQASTQKAKELALQSVVIGFGILVFCLFLLSAIVMSFVDLGNQLESHVDLHFSGMMVSSLYLILLGFFVFSICFGVSRILSAQERKRLAEQAAAPHPNTALVLFAEHFLEQLMGHLNRAGEKKEAE